MIGWMRKQLDAAEPHFTKGGKYEKWFALYEAVDTFLYSPPSVTHAPAHVRDSIDLKRIMILVWMFTFPAMLFGMWNVGYQALTVLQLAAAKGVTPDMALDGWRFWVVSTFGGFTPTACGPTSCMAPLSSCPFTWSPSLSAASGKSCSR